MSDDDRELEVEAVAAPVLIELAIENVYEPVASEWILVLREKHGPRYLALPIGASEAQAIAAISWHLQRMTLPRPMTHDLLRIVIERLAGSVERVVISELRDEMFVAVVQLKRGRRERLTIDARASDAIALAQRAQAPIFVDEAVLNRAPKHPEAGSYLRALPPEAFGKYAM